MRWCSVTEPVLKAYFWTPDRDGDRGGVVVVAESGKEAAKLGYSWWGRNIGHDEPYIEQRCVLMKSKDINLADLPRGTVAPSKEGLRRGFYGWIEDTCDMCGKEAQLSQVLLDSGKCICSDCEDTL